MICKALPSSASKRFATSTFRSAYQSRASAYSASAAEQTTNSIIESGLTSRSLANFRPRSRCHFGRIVGRTAPLGFSNPLVGRGRPIFRRDCSPKFIEQLSPIRRRQSLSCIQDFLHGCHTNILPTERPPGQAQMPTHESPVCETSIVPTHRRPMPT